MENAQELEVDASGNVKQLAMGPAIRSLGYVFWIVGAMEMVERLAFYGVQAVASLYATDPVSKHGLGITIGQYGTIAMVWAITQSLVPAFTGGLSDRYGYKETIFLSTVVKIIGYILMASFPTYYGFMAGAVVLAAGTAIFKPGIQGTLVNATNRTNSSIAWGIFYQTVNIGGFLGPLVAGYMRKMDWKYVFFSCAAAICCNFLLLLTYREPKKEERLERARLAKEGKGAEASLWRESLRELAKPQVFLYILAFSGFWFMFWSIFTILTNHIQDWVDTRGIVNTLFGAGGPTSGVVKFFVNMNKEGTEILPEGMLNLNAGLIMTTCFFFGWLSGKMDTIKSIVIGTLLATLSMVLSGYSSVGWLSVFAILTFSVGEMLSSPQFNEFIGNLAPSDKKAMYLGFKEIAVAIGWGIEGKVGPWLYDHYASKERFSHELLAERGITGVPQGEAFQKLMEVTGQEKWALTGELYRTHNPSIVWYVMACVGVVSALGIYMYGRWMRSYRLRMA